MPSSLPSFLSETPPAPAEYLTFLTTPSQETEPSGSCSFDLVVALAAKGFVILTGQSGTGKSKSAIELGQGLDSLDEYETGVRGSSYELVAVGADWTDDRPLLGYTNPFGMPRKGSDDQTTHVSYEIPDALRLVIRAASPSTSPVPCMLILDEMNLSHVERYFSPFLSLIEANRSSSGDSTIPLLGADKVSLIAEVLAALEPNSPETTAAQELVTEGRGLQIPPNLMVVGTVNVDETTYMFSPKVLDRAHVLELHSVQPDAYFDNTGAVAETMPIRTGFELLSWAVTNRKERVFDQHPKTIFKAAKEIVDDPEIGKLATATQGLLNGTYTLLDPVGFGFGFRAVNEVCAYLLCWIKAKALTGGDLAGWQDALDKVFLQKILPKIHGNRRQLGDSMAALEAYLSGGHEESEPPAKYRLGTSEPISIPKAKALDLGVENQMAHSQAKLNSMQTQLQAVGYATFIR